jgi:hypothetical protein
MTELHSTSDRLNPRPIGGAARLDGQSVLARLLLWAGALLSILLFYAAGVQFGIPARPGYAASVLQQPHWFFLLPIIAIVFFVSLFLGMLFTGRIHHEGGLFCAAIGLSVLSARGGPMRYVLFEANGRGVYLLLALEIILLGVILLAAWLALRRFRAEPPLPAETVGADAPQKYISTIMHILVMIALMTLLAQSDRKAQALASVAISSVLASLLANWFAPASPGIWFWASPLFVGLLGYVAGFFSPAGLEIGRTSGYFAALARPLPLDYASLGTAGAILGYWISSRWHLPEDKILRPAASSASSA